jgi:carbonic anhydrase
MKLFEAITDANHRAVGGDASAGLRPAEYADSLPVVALTCIDPRLNAFFPNALALPGEQFIWLRNAGNIITSPLSSTMRSIALACAVKGGREIAIIGHTDCQVCRTSALALLEEFKSLGVDRGRLPENLSEFFGLFGSERQNVIKAVDMVRQSPLIGPKIPVHGFLIDTETGKLEWLVNGYQTLPGTGPAVVNRANFDSLGSLGTFKDFSLGEMKFPGIKIGDTTSPQNRNQETQIGANESVALPPKPVLPPPPIPVNNLPPKIPLPAPIRPKIVVGKKGDWNVGR